MTDKQREEIIIEAMQRATEVIGVDPAYFGDEGKEEVDKQIVLMGYDLKDFQKKEYVEDSEE